MLRRTWRAGMESHNGGLRNTRSVSPARRARTRDPAVRQQVRRSAEYRHQVLADTFEEGHSQARTTGVPGSLSTLHDPAFQCSRCHYTSPPDQFMNYYGP